MKAGWTQCHGDELLYLFGGSKYFCLLCAAMDDWLYTIISCRRSQKEGCHKQIASNERVWFRTELGRTEASLEQDSKTGSQRKLKERCLARQGAEGR